MSPLSKREAPRVSLVVCTTGRSDRVAALAARLSAVLDACAPRVEVVLVDNSRDGGVAVEDPRVRVVRCAVPGLSLARTTGCVQAAGDVLVFTDDDVEFDAGWPERIGRPVSEGVLDAAAAPVGLGPEFGGVRSVLRRQWLAEANLDGEVRLVGAGMALHRRLLGLGVWDARLGAGRPDFAFGEETLFEYMIRAAGARVGVVEDAGVVHHPDPDRLTPEFWHRTAFQKGLSGAYLAYHWFGETMRLPAARVWRRRARRAVGGRSDGDAELVLVESIGRAEGFRRLRGEPRAYWPRVGASPGATGGP